MRLRPRGHTPVPERNDNRAGERGEEATTRKPWGLRGTSVTSVMCWTSERPRSFRRSCRSTSARRSPSGRTMCSERPASTCPPRPSATTWRCSSPRATSSSHTRAPGRVPTDKGYRFFVDSIARPGPLDSGRALQVRSFFANAHGALEQMLFDTSQLLTRLTDHAAVVVGAPLEQATIRSVQLVGLSSRVVLAVTVLSNGAVERQTIELGAELADDQIAVASSHLARAMVGTTASARVVIPPTGDASVDGLIDAAHAALTGTRAVEPIYVGGVARMAEAFDAVETVRSVLRTLEEQYVVVSLVRDILDRGLSVAIGSELGLEQLAACSVVVAPFEIDGEPAGSIGVVGPDPHELRAGARVRGDREPAPRSTAQRGLGSIRAGGLLRSARRRSGREQRRHQEGVPPPRSRAASRREPRLARSRGEVQGGRARVRSALEPGAARALRPVRSRRRRCHRRRRELRWARRPLRCVLRRRVRWRQSRPERSATRLRPRGRRRPRPRASGVRRAGAHLRAHRGHVRRL